MGFCLMIIALTQRVDVYQERGERRDALDQRYCHYITGMGFIPYPFPNLPDQASAILQQVKIGGLVLTGGNDLHSHGGDTPERDATEKKLIDYCLAKNIPVLGICRGMQMLADYCIGASLSPVTGHIACRHEVKGAINKSVNSYHGWQVNPFTHADYKTLALADDGSIEAFCHLNKSVVGISWHPEREEETDQEEQCNIQSFFTTGKFLS